MLVGFSVDDAVAAHRLVMRVVRERLAADGRLAAVAAEAVQLLARLRGEITEAWRDPAGVRELADHISALTGCVQRHLNPPDAGLAAGLLQVRLGSVHLLNTLGDSTGQAIAVAGPLADDCAQTLGADHPGTLSAFTNLAYAYRAAGRTAEAIPLLERTLADSERVLGADHPNTLTSRNNLARLPGCGCGADGGGNPAAGADPRRPERVLGADHPATRIVRGNLAELTHSASDGGATRG